MHDLDDHLAGCDRLEDLDADRAFLDLVGEGAGDIERHVGLDQRTPHFAQRRLDVGLRQRAAPGQAVEDAVETFGKTVEHRRPSRHSACPSVASSSRRSMQRLTAWMPVAWARRQRFALTGHDEIARGRIALSGGCLRSLGPVGGQRFSLLRERVENRCDPLPSTSP